MIRTKTEDDPTIKISLGRPCLTWVNLCVKGCKGGGFKNQLEGNGQR